MIKSNVSNLQPARERLKQEIVLLSHGYHAKESFPDGKCIVYPWDSQIDEWILRNSRKAGNRNFMWELAKQLCDLNGCPVEKMPVGDVNTVILVSRSIKHDGAVTYAPTCTRCGEVNATVAVKIPDELERIGEKTADYPGYDTVTLPRSQDVVRVRPRIVQDEIMLDARSDTEKKKLSEKLALLLCGIIDIGGGKPEKADEVIGWYHALHPEDQDSYVKSIDKLSPHLSLEMQHVCDLCRQPFVNVLPIDEPDFFRSSGSDIAQRAVENNL